MKFVIQWNLCPSFPYVLFSCKYCSLVVPKNCPREQCIIILDVSFLKVLFSHISHSEFLVLTHSIFEMVISEKDIPEA
jgi:hypothetical protein